MTVFRASVLDTPANPFDGASLRADADAGFHVHDGEIVERGPFAEVRARHRDDEVVELRDGVLLPGLVDTHVHFPQLRIVGALGRSLLDWLDAVALPEEARFADDEYARAVAAEFVGALAAAGTTTALVFGAHFPGAVGQLFAAAEQRGLRITSGLVLGDRNLRPELHTNAQRAYDESRALADEWHGRGRARYAVTPRFSLSCTDELLEVCGALCKDIDGAWFTSHLNENVDEIAAVRELFGGAYLDSYARHGLVGPSSVFAHDVHPTDAELALLAASGASVSHCPTSNAAIGSGMFPLARHLGHGVPVSLGSDVGGGTDLSLLTQGMQAYFIQRLLGGDRVTIGAAHLLYLATRAGARALGLGELVGDLSPGRRFDAVWLRPAAGTALSIGLAHAADADDALAKLFAMGGTRDVAAVWVDGALVAGRAPAAAT